MIQSIKEKIRQRRLQILVHSCIYYKFDTNIVSDAVWNKWSKELVQLQVDNPKESKEVEWYDAFENFDGSTGFDLPIDDFWVMRKAQQLIQLEKPRTVKTAKKVPVKKKAKLF